MKAKELVLFVDAQNLYRSARDAFFSSSDHHSFGQIHPIKLGKLVSDRTKGGATLKQVRVYTGRPDPIKQPGTYTAHMKQCEVWTKLGAEVIARPLRYPIDWPNSKAQEKGIDVALAVDFVAMAVKREYEIGVITSTDTDLKPALEFVYSNYRGDIDIAVVAWKSSTFKSRLSISSGNIWCHHLTRSQYDQVADITDYNI